MNPRSALSMPFWLFSLSHWRRLTGARGVTKNWLPSYLHLYQAGPESYRLHRLRGDIEAARGRTKEKLLRDIAPPLR